MTDISHIMGHPAAELFCDLIIGGKSSITLDELTRAYYRRGDITRDDKVQVGGQMTLAIDNELVEFSNNIYTDNGLVKYWNRMKRASVNALVEIKG